MTMTVLVTRDVEARYRGYIASIMLEVAPGIYVSPNLSAAVRERLWDVIHDWYEQLTRGAIVMVWRDSSVAGNLALRHLGDPPKEIWDAEGILLVRRS